MAHHVSIRATRASLALAIAVPCATAQATEHASMAAAVVTDAGISRGADDILSDYKLIGADDIARSNRRSAVGGRTKPAKALNLGHQVGVMRLLLIVIADTVIDMAPVKHAFGAGIGTQAGIEW